MSFPKMAKSESKRLNEAAKCGGGRRQELERTAEFGRASSLKLPGRRECQKVVEEDSISRALFIGDSTSIQTSRAVNQIDPCTNSNSTKTEFDSQIIKSKN